MIVARQIAEDIDSLTMTAHQFAAAFLVTLVFAIPSLADGRVTTHPAIVSAWSAAVGLGVVGFAGSFLLYNYAVGLIPAGQSSIVVNLMPVFGILTAALFLRESLSVVEFIGAGLIIASIAIFPNEDAAAPSLQVEVPPRP